MKLRTLALVALVSACGPPPHPVANTARPPVVTSGDLDASKLLSELSARAITLGAGPVSMVASGQLSAGERIGAFVEIPDDACLLAYARASSSLEDIDVAVFAEEGNPVAVDEAPDPHPTVLLCPPHPSRVYAAVHAASGEGLVALGAQIVPRDRAGDIGKALRAHGARGEMPSAEAWPGLADKVLKHRAALGGTWEEQRRVAVAIDERAPTMVAMPIDAGECVDALVLAGDDASMLDAEVMDDATRVVARNSSTAKELSLVVCSETVLHATLVIRPHIGAGVAAVVLARAPISAANDIAAPTHLAWLPTRTTLQDARSALDADLVKQGYGAPTSATNVAAVLGRRVTVAIDPADACKRIDVIGGAPVAWVRASVWDDKGLSFSEGSGSAQVVLFACGKSKLGVDVDVRGRGGPLAVVTRKEKWQSPSFAAHPVAASRMLAHSALTSAIDGTPANVRDLSMDSGRRERWEANIAAGACVVTTAGAEGDGTGLMLDVTDVVTGEVLDRGAAPRATSVRACAGAAVRRVRYEARVTSGKLDVIVGDRTRVSPTP